MIQDANNIKKAIVLPKELKLHYNDTFYRPDVKDKYRYGFILEKDNKKVSVTFKSTKKRTMKELQELINKNFSTYFKNDDNDEELENLNEVNNKVVIL